MKNKLALLYCIMLTAIGAQAQWVADNGYHDYRQKQIFRKGAIMGDSGQVASALLELRSTTQGLLIPRMTNTQMNAISSPATGLVVYNTTNSLMYWYEGSSWLPVGYGSLSASNGITLAGNIAKLGGSLTASTTINANNYDFLIRDTTDAIVKIGIIDIPAYSTKEAYISNEKDGKLSKLSVNNYGTFMTYRDTGNTWSSQLNLTETETSLNRVPYAGKLLAISNTDDYNIMSSSAGGVEIARVYQDDSIIHLLVSRTSDVKFVNDAVVGLYHDVQRWRIDSTGFFNIGSYDSVTIYSMTPRNNSFGTCSNCSGGGKTGRLMHYINGQWNRVKYE